MKKLLSKGSTNSKLAKNENFGVSESYILYLAPFNQNSKGVNICPKASPLCAAACLFSAGRGAFSNVIKARTEKTEFLLSDRSNFLSLLWNELSVINRKAGKAFKRVPVRLNGTSDLDWPNLFRIINKDMFELENVIFYDYSKVSSRLKKYADKPYHITFSRSEVNEVESLQALKDGFNVAIVFRNELPDTWNGFKVVNGDESDLRFLDERNVVVGLKAKGKARKAVTGFVVD